MNIFQEKSIFINKIKEIVFDNNGIIFGGAVRDKIISEYYKQKFIEKKSTSDFWNSDTDNETSNRLLLPDDIDIYFSDIDKYLLFMKDIKNKFSVSLSTAESSLVYNNIENVIKSKHNISFVIGKTFTYPGIIISISIDIIYALKGVIIEPPFMKTDFICNIFIENKEGIRISKNTGTLIDTMNDMEKITISAKIMNDIVNFKTLIAGNYNKKIEKILVMRICKLLHKKWTIDNLPFTILKNDEENDEEICVICQSNYKINEKIVKLKQKKCIKYHCDCFIKYLYSRASSDRNDKFVCPLRFRLDFIDINIPDYNNLKYL
jgi:hypothetical protein